MIKTLYAFRHGETEWNRERRLQGQTDIPLNELGRAQAQSLCEFFRRHPVAALYSSDLSRARETAELAAGPNGIPVIIDSAFRETQLGDAEGLTQAEVVQVFGHEVWAGWCSSSTENHDFRFPNGESKAEVIARVLAALEKILHGTECAAIGLSTHGGVVRRLIHHADPSFSAPTMIGNAVVHEFSYDTRTKVWRILK